MNEPARSAPALLAIVVGSAVIAIGGEGIQPMQERWQQALQRWDQEKPQMPQQIRDAGGRVQKRTDDAKATTTVAAPGGGTPRGTSSTDSR